MMPKPAFFRAKMPKLLEEAGSNSLRASMVKVTDKGIVAGDPDGRTFEIEGTPCCWPWA
jgi:hypothetical protein